MGGRRRLRHLSHMNIPMFFPLTGGQNESANQSFRTETKG
ncbi:MAG: hypothetical protein RLZZ326_2244 [Planctomycetota bacterium]